MRRGLICGILLWLIVTGAMRIWGRAMLPMNPSYFAGAFLMYGGAAMFLTLVLLRFVCPEGKSERFGLGMAIPGLILGATTMLVFGQVFPDGTPSTRGHYGSLMLWIYGLILAVIALLVPKPPSEDAP